ncbi:MAG TPA: hypothetical protein VH298_10870 [Jatrophihabitans sp.]|jgi:hypothetical protein|nr:hypothetical protein [Jatrophihabitans sp.]
MSQISRRALFGRGLLVLSAGVGAALGLQHRVHHRIAVPPPAPPAELTAALDRQRSLLAGYDRITDDQLPARAGLRKDLQAHGDALRALLELYPGWRLAQASPSPSSSPSGSSAPAPSTPALLATASRGAAGALSSSCLHWPAGEAHAAQVVPMLGCMAACLDSHVEVLTG